jgi:thiamine thiazole synthase
MPIFHPASEKDITTAIVKSFLEHLEDCVESDVIIVGGGPSGLMAGRELAKAGVKALIVERNNYLGGGFWMGGYLMNKVTVRAPAQGVLEELAVPYQEASEGLFVSDAPHACSKLIASACDAGVKVLNMTSVDDIVLREDKHLAGVVVNWTPIAYLPQGLAALDPVPLESKLVIDASGHEACVAGKLGQRGLVKIAGEGAMWIEGSEDAVVERTGEIYPGLIVAGMAVSTVYGLPRMGPTFGSMLLSGKRAAEVALGLLGKEG